MSKLGAELVRLHGEICKIESRHLPMLFNTINPTILYSGQHIIKVGRFCLARLHANPLEHQLEDAVRELRDSHFERLDIHVLAAYFEIQISKNTWLLSTLGESNTLREEIESRNQALRACKAFFSQLAATWEDL